MKFQDMVKAFWRDEDGGETIEWPLIVALVVAVAVVGYATLGTRVGNALSFIGSSLKTTT